MESERKANATELLVDESESTRLRAKEILDANAAEFEQQFKDNQDALGDIGAKIAGLDKQIPDINYMVRKWLLP